MRTQRGAAIFIRAVSIAFLVVCALNLTACESRPHTAGRKAAQPPESAGDFVIGGIKKSVQNMGK